jgi:hypothetical protein
MYHWRTQLGGAGDVIGMRVGLDHNAQAQLARLEVSQIVLDTVGPRVDEGRFPRVGVGDEIREARLVDSKVAGSGVVPQPPRETHVP